MNEPLLSTLFTIFSAPPGEARSGGPRETATWGSLRRCLPLWLFAELLGTPWQILLGVGGCEGKSCVAQAPEEGAHLGNRRGRLAHSFLVKLSKNNLSTFPVPWRSFLLLRWG